MNPFHITLAGSLLLASFTAAAEVVPTTPAGWLAQMGDFSGNTLPARSPANFVGFLHAATEPAYWGKATDTVTSPGMVGNMAAVGTPRTAMQWTQAMTDPRFYEAVGTVLGDQYKWARWSMASMEPASYQPFAKPFDPALQARWQAEMQSPENWRAMLNLMTASPLAKPAH